MWYHVCIAVTSDRGVFRTLHCTRSWLKAQYLKWKEMGPGRDVWVRRDKEHADPDYKQFLCPDCGNKMSSRELSSTWDWAGPHCNQCGCTGMRMFASVSKPILTARQSLINAYKKILGEDHEVFK